MMVVGVVETTFHGENMVLYFYQLISATTQERESYYSSHFTD